MKWLKNLFKFDYTPEELYDNGVRYAQHSISKDSIQMVCYKYINCTESPDYNDFDVGACAIFIPYIEQKGYNPWDVKQLLKQVF